MLSLTEGVLQSTPTIHSIESATVYYSKVEHGDLFISSNQQEINQAIKNGAYAIVYDNDSIVKMDEEIAWIKVSDIQLAAFKLIRYVVLKKESTFHLLSPHEMSFLKMILTHRGNLSFIANDWRKAFEQILNSDHKLFVGDNKALMELIHPGIQGLKKRVDGYIVFDTLFRTTFKVDGFVYQEKELIPFHLEHLLKVISFCHNQELPFSLERLKYTKHFTPIFIDKALYTTQASKSDKVTIFTDNIEDIIEAREYIRRSNTWVKGIVLTPPKTKVPGIDRPHWFETKDEVREILKNTLFNYAFIYNADKSILTTIKEEYKLF